MEDGFQLPLQHFALFHFHLHSLFANTPAISLGVAVLFCCLLQANLLQLLINQFITVTFVKTPAELERWLQTSQSPRTHLLLSSLGS